jgi:hypothetical protein
METFLIKDLISEQCINSILTRAICQTAGLDMENIIKKDGNALSIEAKINGIEVSFKALVDHMTTTYDDAVKRAAIQLLKDKFSSIQDSINNMEEHVVRATEHALDVHQDLLGWQS